MREIKFKSWDKDKNKMFNVFGIKWNTKHEFIIANDEWNGKDVWCPGESFSDIVMQYTGLKDKNGKEIYEGDIVKLYDSYNKVFTKDGVEVFFNNGYVGGWVVGTKDNFVSLGARKDIEVEIIGNIYENPELLTN